MKVHENLWIKNLLVERVRKGIYPYRIIKCIHKYIKEKRNPSVNEDNFSGVTS